MCVRVVTWRLVPGGSDDFHERYLLTDRGGYKLCKGFDEEPGRTQPVGLLDEPEWNRLWAVYRDGTPSLLRDCEIPLALSPDRSVRFSVPRAVSHTIRTKARTTPSSRLRLRGRFPT
jgi:hypothetical protein